MDDQGTWQCDHDETDIRRRRRRNAQHVYVEQCQRCGAEVRAVKATSPSVMLRTDIQPFDEDLPVQYAQEQNDYHRQRAEQYNATREALERQFWHDYDLYLQTPAWKAKRRAVLERAAYRCEGCGGRPAQHVHHTTYKHVFEEFLFELVAVCRECHQRLHPDKTLDL